MYHIKELKVLNVQGLWARLASFGQVGLISDPLMVSKFHKGIHDPKGQENKIYSIVKRRNVFQKAYKRTLKALYRLLKGAPKHKMGKFQLSKGVITPFEKGHYYAFQKA